MDKGTLIEFRLHGKRRLAVMEGMHGKKHWLAVDAQGQRHTLHPRQITHEVEKVLFSPEDIVRFQGEVEPHIDPSCLEVAWEFLQEETAAPTLAEMSELLFASSTPQTLYATHCLLFEDRLYFKRKGDTFEARSAVQIEELKHQEAVKKAKEEALQGFRDRIAKGAGATTDWSEEQRQRLKILQRFALQGSESPERVPAQETLAGLERAKSPEEALKLLIEVGVWGPHEFLALLQSDFPVDHSSQAQQLAQDYLQTLPPDLDQAHRVDLRHLAVYTIDDPSTREIDDGLSLECLADGQVQIWVHIADPSRLLQPDDALDQDALDHSTTLYLPEATQPMFPEALATGPMSLVIGQDCAALSFAVRLDQEGAVQDYRIQPSWIRPSQALSYEQADQCLATDTTLAQLMQWAEKREQWRKSQGAISIQMPEAMIFVQDEQIRVQKMEQSPSRRLVGEMMILTGEITALYGIKHQLPLPYRSQPQPDLPPAEVLAQLPEGPVRGSALRRCMSRTKLATSAAPHASLGLSAYVQASSPIRRYTDLLTHFQLKAHLAGRPAPFEKEAAQERIQQAAARALQATRLERQRKRYWALEFLRREGQRVWPALMLRWIRPEEGQAIILLEEPGLEMLIRFKKPTISLGQQIAVKVSHVDPRKDDIRFVLV